MFGAVTYTGLTGLKSSSPYACLFRLSRKDQNMANPPPSASCWKKNQKLPNTPQLDVWHKICEQPLKGRVEATTTVRFRISLKVGQQKDELLTPMEVNGTLLYFRNVTNCTELHSTAIHRTALNHSELQ